MRKLLIAAGVVPLLACSAEDLSKFESQASAITEVSHVVTARLHRGAVLLTVSRQVRNDSQEYEELTHRIELPDGAIVTSLRVGSEGTLLEAEDATTRWADLLSPGDADPTISAMLEWSHSGQLDLRLFGFAPGTSASIEYDVQLPPSSEAGSWAFDYPTETSPDWNLAEVTLDVSRIPGASFDQSHVRMPRAPIDRADARWALYRLGDDRTLWRFELDAAQVLEPAPLRPNVVFVIDASHTQGEAGITAQLELLAPYLANAPDAQVEVVLYRRFAERLFGRFIPASDVARMLAATPRQALAPGNGSHLDRGAQLAAEALGQVSGVGRIVLFTDEQLREGFTNEQTIARLAKAPPGTVVHVVSRSADTGTEDLAEVRDTGTLDPIAAAAGGIFLRVSGHPNDPAQAASTLLGLVRPIRIDDFTVEARGLEGDRLDAPEVLAEGSTLRYTAIAAQPPREVTVTGKIWAREYRKIVAIDPDLSVWMPGLAIGLSEVEAQLTDDEVRTAALSARAVSRMTSYLSIKPAAGASRIGMLQGSLGLSGFGTSGCGCGGSYTHGCSGIRMGGPRPDYEGTLRSLFATGVAACVREHRVQTLVGSITIEATGDEIVDVEAAASSPELAACLTEVAWTARLPGLFTAHGRYDVVF